MSFPNKDQGEPDYDQGSPLESAQRRQGIGLQLPVLTIGAIVLVLIGLAFLAYSLSSSDEKPIYPILPTATGTSATPDFNPIILSFAELNADPSLYQGRRIQVSGTFTSVDRPDCPDYTGPVVLWSLVSEELQLNATGFENLLTFLSPGTEMTVLGIWSAYTGPVGCGKQPSEETVWYLAVERILEPNPLVGSNGIILTVIPGEPLPTGSALETTIQPPVLTSTVEGTTDETTTPTLAPGATIATTPTPGLTLLPGTTTTTPGATASPTIPSGITVTPGATPTIDLTITAQPTNSIPGTTLPPLPTSTPSGPPGYPSQPTATATTPSGYP